MMTPKSILSFIFIIASIGLFGCFDKQKKTNKEIPELDTITFRDLTIRAHNYLNTQQKICDSIYNISKYENWFYDQQTGELTFSDSGVKKLIIDFENVGSVSLISNTWLWAWENSYVEDKVKAEIIKVKEFGLTRNFKRLITPKWKADQIDGWEMTAISAFILKAKGAYRVPTKNDSIFTFMIFKNIRWADTTHHN